MSSDTICGRLPTMPMYTTTGGTLVFLLLQTSFWNFVDYLLMEKQESLSEAEAGIKDSCETESLLSFVAERDIFTAASGGRFPYSSYGIATPTAGSLDRAVLAPGPEPAAPSLAPPAGNRVPRSSAGGEASRERKRGREKDERRGCGKQEACGAGKKGAARETGKKEGCNTRTSQEVTHPTLRGRPRGEPREPATLLKLRRTRGGGAGKRDRAPQRSGSCRARTAAQKCHKLRSGRRIAPRFLQQLPEAVFLIVAMESLRRPPDL
ncbi:hypothetical protein NC652_037274 [Populus alba x Populus x berolinensis]|nr:hypothetical protein NC652_037274 [Populus alba x Populus x berolinensis]